jgi:ABC-2 type transport system permease protein
MSFTNTKRTRYPTLLRLRGFLRKETLQIRRDPSSILLALVMPIVLLFLFGYGVSLNPTQIPVAIVNAQRSAESQDVLARFQGSDYLEPILARSMKEAEHLVSTGKVAGILVLQDNFVENFFSEGSAKAQVILNGVDANRANLIRGYIGAALQRTQAINVARGETSGGTGVQVQARTWFNSSNDSRYTLVPGLIALIMTLIGTLLTALIIAREWERGTMEAILATPLRANEFLLGKILPYFALGMTGLFISVVGGVLIFGVPLRGSLWLLVACSSLFLLASLGMGLALSAAMRVQFVAAQASLIAGFLPAFFLSGLLFDLDSTPVVIQYISRAVPASYFVEISHTLFLAGDVWSIVLPAAGALALAALLLLSFARSKLSRRLH